ncbi:MAG: shikimate kinase [Acidimicrobiales bacterium]
MTRHVVLVGLMGSGKSTLGRRLASCLGRDFVDADEALVEITDRTITEIFETDGEDRFRAIEADVLEELLEHHEPTVIASGGGVVLRPDSRRRLRAADVTTVWLDARPAFLASRIHRKAHRPLLAGSEPLRDVLERLHAERAPCYREVADIVVDVEPFHGSDEVPAPSLADHVARLILTHEGPVTQAITT